MNKFQIMETPLLPGFDRVAALLWVATYLLGIAFICFLPPWEGYDEIAHYSYAQQLADTGTRPKLGNGQLSTDVETYRRLGPTPYSTTLPFDENGGITYREWFALDEARESLAHQQPPDKRHFVAGDTINWQAQHPSLYYRLIAPLLKATSDLSWSAQLFALRLLSWTLAFAGFLISVYSTARALHGSSEELRNAYARIALAWPFIFPGFFPEFARLGNDSLVLLLVSLVWLMLIQRLSGPRDFRWYLLLGLLLGIGGLTKVTFLPICAAVIGWLLWIGWQTSVRREQIRTFAGTLLLASTYFALTAKGYLDNLEQQGSMTGLLELSGTENTGLLAMLSALQYPVQAVKGILGMAMTFVWGGSASSAYPPVLFVLPVALLTGLLALCSVTLLKGNTQRLALLAVLVVASVTAGLLYYLFVRVASTGVGAGAPGWYLHTLIAPLSLLLAGGCQFLQRRIRFSRAIWLVWLTYMLAFGVIVTWLQLSLFSACSFKTADHRGYSFENSICVFDFSTIFNRLELLTYPTAGVVFTSLAVVLSIVFFWHLCRVAVSKPAA